MNAARWARRALVALVLVLLVIGVPVASASASGLPATTRITFTVVPHGPVTVGSLVDLDVTVVPAAAVGSVVFQVNGPGGTSMHASITSGRVRVGPASFTKPGTKTITATFVPSDSASYSPSPAVTRTLVVATEASLTVTTTSGVVLLPGAAVAPGQRLLASLAAFPARSRAGVWFDRVLVVGRVVTDARGTALVAFSVPRKARPGAHRVVARTGQVSASVTVVVANSVSTIQTSIKRGRTGTGGSGGTPKPTLPTTGRPPGTLPRTGADTVWLLGVGGLLVVAGGLLVVAGRGRPAGGRGRRRSAG